LQHRNCCLFFSFSMPSFTLCAALGVLLVYSALLIVYHSFALLSLGHAYRHLLTPHQPTLPTHDTTLWSPETFWAGGYKTKFVCLQRLNRFLSLCSLVPFVHDSAFNFVGLKFDPLGTCRKLWSKVVEFD
jgi:hypothetical protein